MGGPYLQNFHKMPGGLWARAKGLLLAPGGPIADAHGDVHCVEPCNRKQTAYSVALNVIECLLRQGAEYRHER